MNATGPDGAALGAGGAPRIAEMGDIAASVVLLTRERPLELRRALDGLRHQTMERFEVIVVGEHGRLSDYGVAPEICDAVVYARCDEANVSMSRNVGLRLARGRIVAFLDDDATPEAGWLEALCAAFSDPAIGAVGGYVRGRSGVAFQWRGCAIDRYGDHEQFEVDDAAPPLVRRLEDGRYLSTVGANCAFRREALVEIGGFDECFRYFLDESDVNLRLAEAGWLTTLAPAAEVHHSFASSRYRLANRAPRSLRTIAASKAYFCRRHGDPAGIDAAFDKFRADQARRLKDFVRRGRITRREAARLMETLEEGLLEGRQLATAIPGSRAFATLVSRLRPPYFTARIETAHRRIALVATAPRRAAVNRAARAFRDAGWIVTILDYGWSSARLKVSFDLGIWRHAGGLCAMSCALGAPIRPRRSAHVSRELERVAAQRGFTAIIRPADDRFGAISASSTRLSGELSGFLAERLSPHGVDPLSVLHRDRFYGSEVGVMVNGDEGESQAPAARRAL